MDITTGDSENVATGNPIDVTTRDSVDVAARDPVDVTTGDSENIATGNTVEVWYPGGEVGDVGELYTHMPTFEKNEEVLVFLKKEKNTNTYKVLNGQEGKLTVIEDSQTGEKITSSNFRVTQLKSQIKSYLNEE